MVLRKPILSSPRFADGRAQALSGWAEAQALVPRAGEPGARVPTASLDRRVVTQAASESSTSSYAATRRRGSDSDSDSESATAAIRLGPAAAESSES